MTVNKRLKSYLNLHSQLSQEREGIAKEKTQKSLKVRALNSER